MAIQFNCPFCTAPIRVPDSSGGKRGRCPKCKSKLRVPKPTPPSAPAPQPAAAPDAPVIAPPPQAEFRPPAAAESPLAAPQGVVSDVVPPGGTGTAFQAPQRPGSYSRALKRRRSRKNGFWIPLLFGVILVGGIAAWFLLQGQTRLEGTLESVELIEPALEQKTLTKSQTGLDDVQFRKAIEYLTEHRIRGLDSGQLMEHNVDVSEAGISIRVLEPKGMSFFRVDFAKHADLGKYYKANLKSLDEPRLKALESGATAFFEECLTVAQDGGSLSISGLERFRRQVAVNRLIGGLGYNVVASVDKTAYLCVYEDNKALYFLLPTGTKRFQLKGRKLEDGTVRFPGRFTIQVTGVKKPKSENPVTENEEPPEKTPDPDVSPPAKTGNSPKKTSEATKEEPAKTEPN